jgi:diacylglycerol O-acyltransferase-1
LVFFEERASLLDSDIPEHSFRGLVNLAILLLVLSNLRLVLTNIKKYGFLVDFRQIFLDFVGDPHSWPSVTLLLVLLSSLGWAYLIEKLKIKNVVNETTLWYLHYANLAAIIILPVVMVPVTAPAPIGAVSNMMLMSILFMKLTSYAIVNGEERQKEAEMRGDGPKKDGFVHYPDNITPGNILYFFCAPTLIYDLNYPRTSRIRYGYIFKCLVKLVVLSALILSLVEQYMMPVVRNAMEPFDVDDAVGIAERVLKLSVPNLYVWLLGFYAFFHVYLNMVAEALRFADRRFYSDWWNSNSIDYFWRNWNIPVHLWMVRHVYLPLVRKYGWSRFSASIAIFAISGVFHELIVSVPFRMIKLWAFLGMFGQIPLSLLTRAMTRTRHWGNLVFWVSILLGQPFLIMMYYRDWYVGHVARTLGGVQPEVRTVSLSGLD